MDIRAVLLAVAAAVTFTGSGLFMKASSGLTRLLPTVGVIVLAICGAALNALAVHRAGELGPAYVLVVGVETVLAFALGAVAFGERISAARLAAIALVLIGALLLASSESSDPAPAAAANASSAARVSVEASFSTAG